MLPCPIGQIIHILSLLSELLTIFQRLLEILSSAFTRDIIDDDNKVFAVVLLSDGVQIEKISKSFVVLVARTIAHIWSLL